MTRRVSRKDAETYIAMHGRETRKDRSMTPTLDHLDATNPPRATYVRGLAARSPEGFPTGAAFVADLIDRGILSRDPGTPLQTDGLDCSGWLDTRALLELVATTKAGTR